MSPDLLAQEPSRHRLPLLAMAAVVALALGAREAPPAAPHQDLTVLAAEDSGGATLRLTVRNDGTAGVTALRGGVGGFGLLRPVEVAPGTTRVLVLQADGCPAEGDALALSVRTTGSIRQVRLPLPAGHGSRCWSCGCGSRAS